MAIETRRPGPAEVGPSLTPEEDQSWATVGKLHHCTVRTVMEMLGWKMSFCFSTEDGRFKGYFFSKADAPSEEEKGNDK